MDLKGVAQARQADNLGLAVPLLRPVEADVAFTVMSMEAFLWLFACPVRSPKPSGPVRSLGPSGAWTLILFLEARSPVSRGRQLL